MPRLPDMSPVRQTPARPFGALTCGLLGVGLTLAGCRASLSVNAKANTDTATKEQFAPSDSDVKGDSESDYEDDDTALLGARHDLKLAPAQPANCQCLSVVVGAATNPAFQWQGGAPKTNPAKQLVLGLSSEGVNCPNAPKDTLGASYWGYTSSGQDVIVIVEPSRFGRPVTQGAIVPKPPGTGQIYVRGSTRDTVYGRSSDGTDALCRVLGPSTVRE